MQKSTTFWGLLGLCLSLFLFSNCSNKFEKIRRSSNDSLKYVEAEKYYKLKEYEKAGVLFDEIAPTIKLSKFQENAYFYQAYCDYHLRNYAVSSYKFKKFAETFGLSDRIEEAQYMSAYSLYKDSSPYNLDQASTNTAIDEMQTFINNYPESTYRQQSQDIIVELRKKLERKSYERAKLYYQTSPYSLASLRSSVIAITNFQRDFPDSEYNEEMASLKIKAEYELAISSFDSKQKERFEETVKFYQNFLDKYPKSKFIKSTEKYYELAQKELDKVLAEEKKRKAEKDANQGTKVSSGTSN
jgi:outer membrane protein assembly factor BamD